MYKLLGNQVGDRGGGGKPKKGHGVAQQKEASHLFILDTNPSPRTPPKPPRTKPLTPLHPGDLPNKNSPKGGAPLRAAPRGARTGAPLPGRGGAQGRKDGGLGDGARGTGANQKSQRPMTSKRVENPNELKQKRGNVRSTKQKSRKKRASFKIHCCALPLLPQSRNHCGRLDRH